MMSGLLTEPDGVGLGRPFPIGCFLSFDLSAGELITWDLCVIGRGLPCDIESVHPGSDFQLSGGEDHWERPEKREENQKKKKKKTWRSDEETLRQSTGEISYTLTIRYPNSLLAVFSCTETSDWFYSYFCLITAPFLCYCSRFNN